MKFHIFASNTPNFRCKLKDDLADYPDKFSATDLQFDEIVYSMQYTDVYLVCDLGVYKPKFMEYVSVNDNMFQLPFIVVKEHHFSKDWHSGYVENKCSIVTDGFREEFETYRAAIMKFNYYINAKVDAVFFTAIKPTSKKCNKVVADTRTINRDEPRYIKRFEFDICKIE